jgi:hypothetical protein
LRLQKLTFPKLLHKKSFQQDYREYMHKKSILPIER